MPIKVAIVEDDDGIRDALSGLIAASEGFEPPVGYASAEEAIGSFDGWADVMLMDINLPGASGIDCVRHIKAAFPDVQIMMLTVFDDPDVIFASLKAGASGYLLKRTRPDHLLTSVRELYEGGSPMSSQIARKVVQSFHSPTGGDDPVAALTPREEEILGLLAKGYRYKEIADQLFIHIETVRSHIRSIYEKLHVRSRTEAVVKYLKR